MWLLTLTESGLIASALGRKCFIAFSTVAAFAVGYLGNVGRAPIGASAQVVFPAFAGGTIVVLAIDCFTRTGYKEFWVYLWSEIRTRPRAGSLC